MSEESASLLHTGRGWKQACPSVIATAPDSADATTRTLLERWGRLHAVRGVLGAIATVLFLAAAHNGIRLGLVGWTY